MSVAHTPSQMNRNRHPLDTPTPASSSGHNSALITSLKPSRSRSNLSPEIKRAFPNAHQQQQPNRVAFGNLNGRIAPTSSSSFAPPAAVIEEETEILTDNTERERRKLEDDIRMGMGELNRRGLPSGASSSGESIGYGDLSDLDQAPLHAQSSTLPRQGYHQGLRARIEDESSASGDDAGESSEPSIGDDFSLRIGLAGTRNSAVSVPTGSAIRAAASALDQDDLTFTGLHRSPVASPPYARGLRTDENRAPQAAIPAAKSFPTRSSPINQASRSSALHSSPALGPSSLNRVGANQTTASTPRFESSYRVPDVTGLTDGLSSPIRSRNHYAAAPVPARPNSAMATSSEAAALSNALDDLRLRLQQAEADKTQLQRKLAQQQQPARSTPPRNEFAPSPTAAAGVSRREVEAMLRADRERVDAHHSDLHARLTHLERQVSVHEELISQLSTNPRPEIRAEVTQLKNKLRSLVNEQEVVKGVVEELLQNDEVKRQWESEEEARRRDLMDRAAREREREVASNPPPTAAATAVAAAYDPDRTPRAKQRTYSFNIPVAAPANRPSTAPPRQQTSAPAAPAPAPAPIVDQRFYDDSYLSSTSQAESSAASSSSVAPTGDPVPDFARAEAIFRSVSMQNPAKKKKNLCEGCQRKLKARGGRRSSSKKEKNVGAEEEEEYVRRERPTNKIDHRVELRRTLDQMEKAFLVQKEIYIELSDKYRAMDSSASRRRALANHLKESIDVLEAMADEIKRFDACFHQFTSKRQTEGVI